MAARVLASTIAAAVLVWGVIGLGLVSIAGVIRP